MTERTIVVVRSEDPVLRAGLTSQLWGRPEVALVNDPPDQGRFVAVFGTDDIDEFVVCHVRQLRRNADCRCAVIATRLDTQAVMVAAEAGVSATLRRFEATSERLASLVVRVAAGHGELPADLLGELLENLGRLQEKLLAPRGLRMAGFTERELEIVRMLADGLDTGEISAKLAYSERTVKNTIHQLLGRFNLRNRSHAVAFALRQGLI